MLPAYLREAQHVKAGSHGKGTSNKARRAYTTKDALCWMSRFLELACRSLDRLPTYISLKANVSNQETLSGFLDDRELICMQKINSKSLRSYSVKPSANQASAWNS
jgi:hypothetical protein